MDPKSGSNPINNPRLDLLHNTGNNQQLNGAAGAYGPGGSPAGAASTPSVPTPGAPTGGAPNAASSYVAAAQASRPTSPVGPVPAPRPAPAFSSSAPMLATAAPSGSYDDGESGAGGILKIAIPIVIVLLLLGGFYFLVDSKLNQQNAAIQANLEKLQKGSDVDLSEINSTTIKNAEDITTKTLTVENGDDTEADSLTINGASNFQGPVKFGQDVTMDGSLNVAGDVTAKSFIGDGSQLTGITGGGGGGVAGASGPPGPAGPPGAPNPNALYADAAGRARRRTGSGRAPGS